MASVHSQLRAEPVQHVVAAGHQRQSLRIRLRREWRRRRARAERANSGHDHIVLRLSFVFVSHYFMPERLRAPAAVNTGQHLIQEFSTPDFALSGAARGRVGLGGGWTTIAYTIGMETAAR